MDDSAPPSGFDPVDELAEEYLNRRRGGERPTAAEYAARHPEHAARIIELFPALEFIEGLKPAPEDRSGLSNGVGAGGDAGASGDCPRRLGDYTLLRELGRGGMGIVYESEHESLKNRVALKVMHPRYRADRTYVRRFQTEARSAAKLHHTNIVPVFDYGEQDGVCYYAMQCIVGFGLDRVLEDVRRLRSTGDRDAGSEMAAAGDGRAVERAPEASLPVSRGLLTGRYAIAASAEAVDGIASPPATSHDPVTPAAVEPVPVPPAIEHSSSSSSLGGHPDSIYFHEIARLGAEIADALDYAHRQGIVHRDIKPSNLLLDNQGNVWVTDFGLAKLVEGEDLSRSHDLIGTLRFMAPERLRGVTDPAGDVYSLGATIYEFLALKPAFGERDQARLIAQVADQLPVPLRQHDQRIPRDLETLVQKALAKDPKDRFASAAELADELRRYLESRPIRSRPVGVVERLWRWCKRSPGLALASFGAALLTVILLISAIATAWTFRAQRDQIRQADRKTLDNLFDALTAQARAQLLSREVGQRFESIDALAKATAIARELKMPPDRFDLLRDLAIACLALPDMKKTAHAVVRPPGALAVAFDPTMTRYALRLQDGSVPVFNVSGNREIARFQARGNREILIFSFSPDGRYLATTHYPGYGLTIWDINRRAIAVNDRGSPHFFTARFSPDSQRLAVAQPDGEFLMYDLATGQPVQTWRIQTEARDLAFRPDGTQIAVIHGDTRAASCRIIEAKSGALVRSIALRTEGSVAWSPDGATLAISGGDFKFYLWDTATGISRASLEGSHKSGLHSTFHPTGSLLASNNWEGRLRIWDAAMGRHVFSIASDGSHDLSFSQDGQIFVSRENESISYSVDPAPAYRSLIHVSTQTVDFGRVSVRNDHRLVAMATNQGVALWDLARGTELPFLPIGPTVQVLFEPSGSMLSFSNTPIGVQRWVIQLDLHREEFRIGPPVRLKLPPGLSGIAEDHTGKTLALAFRSTAAFTSAERIIRVGPLYDCRNVAISPDRQWLATGSHSKGAQVWRVRDAKREAVLPFDHGATVVFSPDGKRLMTSYPCQLWTVGTWQEERQITGTGLCFSPDGRSLVVQDADKVLGLVEAETGRVLARFKSPDSCDAGSATFTPDGSRLVFSTNDGPAVHVWDLKAVRRELATLGLDWNAPAFAGDDMASPSSSPLPRLQLDLGPLAAHAQNYSEPADVLVQRYTKRLAAEPDDVEAYHHRAHVYNELRRVDEAIDDLTQVIRRRPDDVHLRITRAQLYERVGRNEPAIADLEVALASRPDDTEIRDLLAMRCHARELYQSRGPELPPDPERKLALARRAVELVPDQALYLHALGNAQYRAYQFAEAIDTWERNLALHPGWFDDRNYFYLATAHHRLGNRAQSLAYFDRGVRWEAEHDSRADPHPVPLAKLHATTAAILAGPAGELPADAFAPPRPD